MSDAVIEATAPARWLLGAGEGGVALTQTLALARAVVRDAVERWPGWWDAELFGPPHREADVRVLEELHAGLRRLRLIRRRGKALHTTASGRRLLADPAALLAALVDDLGGGDPFTEMVASVVTGRLAFGACTHGDLSGPAAQRARHGGWRGPDGSPPTERDVSWVVGEVLCRGEAYGLIARREDPVDPRRRRHLIELTAAGHAAFGADRRASEVMRVLVFDAELQGVRGERVSGVGARVAVGGAQHLTALHDALQEAFGLLDDHLYSFWLDGRFWGGPATEYTSPIVPDEAPHTADVPLAELGLKEGAVVAYVFDFGDEWQVRLTLREEAPADGGSYPRVLERTGTAPEQYPDFDDED